jgi:hypothetical protein
MSMLRSATLQDNQPQAAAAWGEIVVHKPAYGPPIDIEVHVEGRIVSANGSPAFATVQLLLLAGRPGDWTSGSPPMVVGASHQSDHRSFSRTLVVPEVYLDWLSVLRCMALLSPIDGQPLFLDGLLTLRTTPSGTALSA